MKFVVCMLAVACIPVAAAADVAALQRCRQISDPAVRLACYDAVDLNSSGPAPAAGQQAPLSPAGARQGAVAPGAAAAASASPPAAQFGLEARRAATTPAVDALESAIAGPFDGWVPRQRLRLANGQVWEISDGSQAAYRLDGPKVRITRGMSGTYFMAIDGVAQTPRVRRVE